MQRCHYFFLRSEQNIIYMDEARFINYLITSLVQRVPFRPTVRPINICSMVKQKLYHINVSIFNSLKQKWKSLLPSSVLHELSLITKIFNIQFSTHCRSQNEFSNYSEIVYYSKSDQNSKIIKSQSWKEAMQAFWSNPLLKAASA